MNYKWEFTLQSVLAIRKTMSYIGTTKKQEQRNKLEIIQRIGQSNT